MRGSVERQIQSQAQTPQPTAGQTARPVSTSHADTSTSDKPVRNRHSDIPSTQTTGTAIAVAIPPRPSAHVPAPTDTTLVSTTPNQVVQRSAITTLQAQDSEDAVAISIPVTRQPSRQARSVATLLADQDVSARQDTLEEASSTAQLLDKSATATVSGSGQQSTEHAAKRRKINPTKRTDSVKKSLVASTSATQTTSVTNTEQERAITTDEIDAGITAQSTRLTKKRQTVRSKGKERKEDVTTAAVANAAGEAGDATGSIRKRKKRSDGGRPRAKTPENAEEVQIDTTKLTMADLCRDRRTGKKSKREKALQARDAEELLKKQQVLDAENTPAHATTGESAAVSHQVSESSDTQATVPGVRIVNGQLVLDESTRTIDRVALANEARGDEEEVVVIDSLSHKVNSSTYMKRERLPKWTEEKTDRFYEGLRMFGTDFGMISKLFPEMSRRTLKHKFIKEERLDLEKINNTLWKERIPVDIEKFSEMTKTKYKDPAELEREMAEDRKVLEEEQAKEKAAMDEAARQRAAEVAAESAENAEQAEAVADSSAKENEAQENRIIDQGKKDTKGVQKPGVKGKRKEKVPTLKGKLPKLLPKIGRRATNVLAPLP